MATKPSTHLPVISKSRYKEGLDCHRLLWYRFHSPHSIPAPDPADEARFADGRQVGDLAKKLYPDGIQVGDRADESEDVVVRTQNALQSRLPVFEASFRHEHAFARADILVPVDGDRWDIVEVKASNKVKKEHYHDVAFQRYAYEGAGLKVRNCYLLFLDKDYVRNGEVKPRKIFRKEDVTTEVSALLREIPTNLQTMLDVINAGSPPDPRTAGVCCVPKECILMNGCWDFLPDNHVFQLYWMGKKGFQLVANGIERITEVPTTFSLSVVQKVQLQAVKENQPHIDRVAIKKFLDSLRLPLYFLDFETFDTAIPMFDRLRPYEKVPFQFSLHVVRTPDYEPEHRSFLAEGTGDPRPELLSRLRSLLGHRGPIVVYHAQFEKGVLKSATEMFPEFSGWWQGIEPRIVDLRDPFSKFWYYHPMQRGSTSLKIVLPILTGKGYEDFKIQEGQQASLEYMRVTFGDVDEGETKRVRKDLEKYCGMDTMGMVWIVQALERLVGQ